MGSGVLPVQWCHRKAWLGKRATVGAIRMPLEAKSAQAAGDVHVPGRIHNDRFVAIEPCSVEDVPYEVGKVPARL